MGSAAVLRRENVQLKRQLRELQRQVITDSLTGVGNRRHFDNTLGRELHRAQRGGYALVLALVDLDKFKAINDLYGHPVGDEVLREVARRLRRSARGGDQIFRYGGEEFALLFAPAASQLDAMALGERIVMAVGSRPIDPVGMVTVSVGLAVFDQAEQRTAACSGWTRLNPAAGALLMRADEALYEAKKAGRHQACLR